MTVVSENNDSEKSRKAELLSTEPGIDLGKLGIRLATTKSPLAGRSLGDVGIAYRVSSKERFPRSFLRVAFDSSRTPWIDPTTIRFFRLDPRSSEARAVWRSGPNIGLGYLWAQVSSPGTYVAIGLPKDRLLLETLRHLAHERRLALDEDEAKALTARVFEGLAEASDGIDEFRDVFAQVEYAISPDTLRRETAQRGRDFGIAAPLLPGGLDNFRALIDALGDLEPLPGGFPEEELFFPPGGPDPLPWPPEPRPIPIPWPWPRPWPRPWLPDYPFLRFPPFRDLLCIIWGNDWPMYMHDGQHTGRARCSGINSSNVSTLTQRHSIPIDGRIVAQPAIVGGRAYVGSMDASAVTAGGYLYKINVGTGVVEGTFSVSTRPGRHGTGVASTPAIVSGKAYVSSLSGHLYRVDVATMTQDWVVDLRVQDLSHSQPVTNTSSVAAGWSSPVVANNRVYVGHGEGESGGHGYVFCVDAATGDVVWLYCTNKFVNPNAAGSENQPNVLPPSNWTGPGAPPAPFALAPANPPERGSSPWSSVAYDRTLNRVYVGTGNAIPDDPLPDSRYASGCISLDAATGMFAGFFQPAPSDSYRPAEDFDVDVPGAPTIFSRDGVRLVGIGSKNGSYFLLDANTMAVVQRRQLLPYDSAGNPFTTVDPPPGTGDRENKSGVFGTAAVDSGRRRLFVGLGGYSGAIDNATTPFIRAMSWNDLSDAWPITGTNPPKYSMAQPPVYSTPGEAGLTNVSSVNDVVFVGTTKPGLYALHADTGLCLWSAGWPATGGRYCFGAAIAGSYVTAGQGDHLYIYSL